MSSYRGRSARISTARMIVWEVLARNMRLGQHFTGREFYVRHKRELESKLAMQVPGIPLEAVVKGALRGLSGKGLLSVVKISNDSGVTYARNLYRPQPNLLGLSYGQALVEAQRRRLG